MKAKVYEDRCIGCGQCEAVCNKVFNIGDEGYAEVICDEIPKELLEDAQSAADGCPTGAIEIKENFEDEKCTCKECECKKENTKIEDEKNAA